ncbi:signal peptidase I [Salipaludibacillus agaradhaerens]|jgi:signal peptidase I|uniref:signal peptidase I n=1 Tax=Salipaludibacillus agaradhaerens TaxID=76935 RepID=UPI000998E54E|nr:signal peptidase I [Salipaludibacillus agaradhaerens]MCR6107091.1 signal peptidase I [Salipaludibacillus agaradhaerens]MCR6119122.1 signal peptidase I [Salipaludibacillus agaradhaerens]UJW58172.1 signal peptidase I [Bacillus sp. A116_S68]
MGRSESWEWIKAVAVALILAIGIRYFLLAPIVVDGQSMMPTLEHNDRMLVNKIGYNISEPERFDIIVFHAPQNKDYIKRVIGLPGDTIEYRDDMLYVNGESVDEPYLDDYKEQAEYLPLTEDFHIKDVTGYETVPEGHVFVLGDNRQRSRDSRQIGMIPYDEVVGKANFVIWPIQEIRFVD